MAGLPARCCGVLLLGALAGCSANAESASPDPAPHLVKEGTLTICTSIPYEPFEFEKDGQIVGFDIDLANAVAARLHLTPAVHNLDFDAIVSGKLLNDGTCDVAVAGITITGDRARALDFSSPYFNAAQVLVVPASSSVHSLADLAGRKLAVQSGTTGETYVTDHAPSTADVVTFDDPALMADAVANGTVAAAVYDNTVVGDVVTRHPGLTVAAEFDTGEQYGMAVQKNGNVELLRVVDDVIATLKSDGGYAKLSTTWFGTAPAS